MRGMSRAPNFLLALLCSLARVAAVVGLMLLGSPPTVKAAPIQGMQYVSTCVITVTTTATSVAALMVTAGCYASQGAIPSAATAVINSSATTVCAGGSAVDTNSTTSGGQCWPICAGCAGDTQYGALASAGAVYLRVAAATQIVIAHVGGNI